MQCTLQIPEATLNLPIFLGHGTADPLIPSTIANATVEVLKRRNLSKVDFRLYPGMGHSACPQELDHLKHFLVRVLPERSITEADIKAMSARELKEFLQSKGIGVAGILEKQELVAKALSSL